MQKFKTRIVYYNNGKVISTNETNILAVEVTQKKVDLALGVILAVHQQTEPYNAMAKVYIGRRKVAEYMYSDNK